QGLVEPVGPVRFSPDGATLILSHAAGSSYAAELWDAAIGSPIRTFQGHTDGGDLVFSPEGTRVLGSDHNAIKLWDVASSALIRTLEGHSDKIPSLAFAPDGRRLLSGSADKTMKLWDATTGVLIRSFEGNANAVLSVSFSRDGTRVLSSIGRDEPIGQASM